MLRSVSATNTIKSCQCKMIFMLHNVDCIHIYRWDNPSHHLTDLPPSSMTSSPSCASSVAASVAGIIPNSDSVDSVGLKLNNQKKAATSSRINRKDGEIFLGALRVVLKGYF